MARILVIDDNPGMRRMLRRVLECEGYEVVDAPDGKVGVRLYLEEPTELVITDLIMPQKDGMKVIMELRREFPGVKIIAISGDGCVGPDHYLPAAKNLGAQRILAKPFERREILEAVGELVNQE